MKKERRVKDKVVYRQARWEDIDALCELELEVWGKEMAAGRDKWESRLKIFPEGVIVAEKNGKLVGVLVIQIIKWNYPSGYFPTWEEVTANGYITNHDSDGDTMYGVNLTTLPDNPGIAQQLLKKAIFKTKQRGITKGFLGCRIPTLQKTINERNIKDINKELVLLIAKRDPEVRFFVQNGFSIIGARNDYFAPDKDSDSWGIILKLN